MLINYPAILYGLLLVASLAFDHVSYLFRTLWDRMVCPLYRTLLLNMYTNQRLRIRWETINSSYFNVANGVKQCRGGGLFLQWCLVFT